MQINTTDASSVSGFYITDFSTFAQTLDETEVVNKWDLGAVAIICGIRDGAVVWLLDNPDGKYAIWVEEAPRDRALH